MRRIAVVSKDGRPLMPTKESRANRWVKGGKAIRKWSKLGFWYVQLTRVYSCPLVAKFVFSLIWTLDKGTSLATE